MSQTILLVAAHADDEALGAGGTLAKHKLAGDSVYIVFMADGVSSRKEIISSANNTKEHIEREQAAQKVAKLLSTAPAEFLGLPDNRMDSIALLDIVQPLEACIKRIKPDIIYTHHYGDLNIDHQVTHRAVMTACRPQNNLSVKTILCFEVLSSTEWQTPNSQQAFEANWFEDISATMAIKEQALQCYVAEMRPTPHTRSIKNAINLASIRGAQVSVDYAEAFMLARNIRD